VSRRISVVGIAALTVGLIAVAARKQTKIAKKFTMNRLAIDALAKAHLCGAVPKLAASALLIGNAALALRIGSFQ
jgi:hypothetical protein